MSDQLPDNSPLPESTPIDWLLPAMPYADANRQPNMPYAEAGTEVIGLDGVDPSQHGTSQNTVSDSPAQSTDSDSPTSAFPDWQGVNDYAPNEFYFG